MNALFPSGNDAAPDTRWVQALRQLFKNPPLSFDDDKDEVDQTGLFPGKHFEADELVGNLIDYIDKNTTSCTDYGVRGIESDKDIGENIFPNQPLMRIGELASIPGFTSNRLRKLMPLLSLSGDSDSSNKSRGTDQGESYININLAPLAVIRSLSPDMTDDMAQKIDNFRKSDEGPFTSHGYADQLGPLIDPKMLNDITIMARSESKWFQVIAKVDYGNSLYFVKASLYRPNRSELPVIKSIEMF